MGMFDSVYFRCPDCNHYSHLEVQSKAGDCVLDNHFEHAVPIVIAEDIIGEQVFCPDCEHTYVVSSYPFISKVPLFLAQS